VAKQKHVSAYEFGLVHLGLGDPDRAIDYFERALEERSSLILYLSVEPAIAPTLRGHPRFQAILRKVQLS
jgi:serine/threonine-protein kinase